MNTKIPNSQHLRFFHLTVEDGLSDNVGGDMVQDSQGFVWISTFDGLNRFDGYEFKTFRHDPDNPYSLSNNRIRGMIIDPDGWIWLATVGGLNRFDPYTETFTRYQHHPDDPDSLGFDFAVSVFLDREGQIWIGGLDAVDCFDPQAGSFTHYRHDPADPDTIGPGQVHRICQDQDGTLWFGNRAGGGLNRLDPHHRSFIHYLHDPKDPHSISDDSIQVVYMDRSGVLWIGTENGGLNRFDPVTGRFHPYRHKSQDPDSLSNDYVRDIKQTHAGQLWIATAGGLNKMDCASARFTRYRHDPANPASLSTDNISRVFEDRNQGLWVTTFQGVNYCSPKHQRFLHYLHEHHNPNSLDNNSVRTIYEDSSGILWIGTEKGLNKFDRARGEITRYQHDPEDPSSLSPGLFIAAIVEDAGHNLWIGSWGGELNCFDPHRERFWRPGDNPGFPRIKDTFALYRDHDQNIWAGDYNKGLYCFVNPGENDGRAPMLVSHHSHDPDDPNSLSANTISVIYEDRANVLWVGTETSGLNRFDPKTETFIRYQYHPQDPTSFGNSMIASILQDQDGILWFGTKNGLYCFVDPPETDPKVDAQPSGWETGLFKRYSEEEGMFSPTVTGILEDKSHPDREGTILWLSTNRGLVKFNPRTETFQCYGPSEGVQTRSEVSGYCKSMSGEMFFGGYGGLTAFNPRQIIDNQDVPPVVITNFLLFNKPVPIGGDSPLQKAIWAIKEIALSDQEYSFAFEFAALSYVDPPKNQYQYKLEGFDQDWQEVNSRRRYAAYTNLPAGEYTFRVLGSNNHGVWNVEGASIKIKVAQPLWEKLRLEKETAVAANQAKSVFISNMSHELRTPLNAILGFAQVMLRSRTLSAENMEYAKIIQNSGEHLLTLINQILDLSRIEAGRIALDHKDFDLHHLLADLTDMFTLKADEKRLQLVFELGANVPAYICADEIKLRQVLINLLNNALKYTEEGSVTIRVEAKPQQFQGEESQIPGSRSRIRICFAVIDTGYGIAPEDLERIFEAFVRIKTGGQEEEGTGLGLSISQHFVQLMGGEIQVKSEPGEGSTFSFEIEVEAVEAAKDWVNSAQRQVTAPESSLPRDRIFSDHHEFLSPEVLASLPAALLTNLKEAALQMNVSEVERLIDETRNHNHGIAEALSHLTDNFQYLHIVNLISKAQGEKSGRSKSEYSGGG